MNALTHVGPKGMDGEGSGAIMVMHADSGDLPCKEGEEEELLAYRRMYEMDQYYDSIKNWTSRTVFMELTVEEVEVWREYNRGVELKGEKKDIFEGFEKRIEEMLRGFGEGAFVRLSTRSPKDAVDKDPTVLIPHLNRHLLQAAKSKNASPRALGPSSALLALRQAFFDCMRVHTAKEVLQLMCLSSRVVSDIKRALDYRDKTPWNLKLIFREFQLMDIQFELRGFVSKGRLTALSQYYVESYWEDLVGRKEEIHQKVLAFFEVVKEHIKIESYVIDFVLIEGEVRIVELNPFSRSTGACLFDWVKDKEVLEEGPFQFRLIEQPNENMTKNYLMPWNHLLERSLSEIDKVSTEKNESCSVM